MVAAAQLPALPIVALMGFGAIVAIAGHATRTRYIVVLGLVLVFLATTAMVVGGLVAYQQGGANTDPRPSRPAQEPGF